VKVILLLTGFLHEQVDAYLEKRSDDGRCTITSVFGGTQGQIAALLKIQHSVNEDFLYAGGDCIFSARVVKSLLRDASKHEHSIAIMATNQLNETVLSHPCIELEQNFPFVKEVHGPGVAGAFPLVGMGLYYFRPKAFEFLSKVEANPLAPTSEFVKHARMAGESVAVSIGKNPWLCLHTPGDLHILQGLDVKEFLERRS
jgi:NDP-sugar pyrophosphorylase family protein